MDKFNDWLHLEAVFYHLFLASFFTGNKFFEQDQSCIDKRADCERDPTRNDDSVKQIINKRSCVNDKKYSRIRLKM